MSFAELLNPFKDVLQGEPSAIPFSMVNVKAGDHIYHAVALERCISIQRLPDGVPMLFSTDKCATYQDVTQKVFDGFEWELTTPKAMIDIYERQVLVRK